GDATSANHIRLNRLKNRTQIPDAGDIDPDVTLEAMMASGSDRDRFSDAQAATIEGYVHSAEASDKESCNCKASTRRLTDTHLEILASAGDTRKPVIAEITPVMRLIHEHEGLEDWSSSAVKSKYEGKKVRITGWLFFDEMHLKEADNTDSGDHD